MHNGSTFVGLVKELKQQVKTFIRQEVQLARTEISEKVSSFGQHTVGIVIGGFAAYAGLIVFLAGLGALLAFAFQHLGLAPLLSAFLGLAIIGFAIIAVGAVVLLKGIHALKKESLAPQRTIETLQHLKGTRPVPQIETTKKKETEKRTSEQLEACVMATEQRMGETLEELADRATFSDMRVRAQEELRLHPYRWGLVALWAGFCSSFLLKRKWAGGKN